MKNTSRSINLHGGIEKIDPNISIPDTWAEHSNRNIQESQSKLYIVLAPYHKIDSTLSQPVCYIYVPVISDILYQTFTSMYTFKASSKELRNYTCLCMHHGLNLHKCLSGQHPNSIKYHVTCND